MTPAELAAVVGDAAIRILTDRGLDGAVIPRPVVIDRPRNPEHGDYATNVALQIAGRVGAKPRELAQWLADALAERDDIAAVDVAGPGFVNIRLATDALGAVVAQILAAGATYGTNDTLVERSINLEFVSANPTGPIHLGGTRWAAVGDALGRILTACGAAVTREYYFNDHGAQIDRYARSLAAAAAGEPAPEDGYAGEYIGRIAAQIVAAVPDVMTLPDAERVEVFRSRGVELMFDEIKRSLHGFGVDFDVYFHENSLFESGAVEEVVGRLKTSGALYEKDGAWWIRSTEYGDDKDRVVIKSDGDAAYIAGDIAYFRDKRRRGFDIAIYMLGADHHGYIGRLKAAAAALGDDPAAVEVLIGQMVNLVRGGVAVKMSKRAGTVVTLEDLVAEIGVDAARYVLIRSAVDTSIDIDLELWTKRSNDNPVYYVQYAHARLCSLDTSAAALGVTADDADFSLLALPTENALIRTLAQFPDVVRTAAEFREPHRIARYLEQLAGDYHRFYGAARVLPQGDEAPQPVHSARLALGRATRQVLRNGLDLLGISAPERM